MAKPQPTKPDPDAVWLTVGEALWLSRASCSWLYLRIRSGEIESKLAGRYRLIRREALERYMDNLPSRRGDHVKAA